MSVLEQAEDKVSYLFITANVGTLFENLLDLADAWTREVAQTIQAKKPHVIAFHFQEVGGKNAKSSMSHVHNFIRGILSHSVLKDFNIIRGYLDEDFMSVEEYTALGSFYMIHKKIYDVQVWDYDKKTYNPITGTETYYGNLKSRTDICKEKFEQGYFPDCKWSRKGYTRVRWKIHNRVFEFVNIHLFHDDNNLVAVQTSPSSYSKSRKRALRFILQRINSDPPPDCNYYCFGDFNFRLDIKSLVEDICSNSQPQIVRSQENDGILSLQYEKPLDNGDACDNQPMLKIERKLFQCDHSLLYQNRDFEKLRLFNVESDGIELKEFKCLFPPTYPFSENSGEGTEYMKTRCPAWCDRVFLSPSAWDWVNTDASNIEYSCIGENICMGDHKPIYLSFEMPMNSVLGNDVD